jgi:hypothetical protein
MDCLSRGISCQFSVRGINPRAPLHGPANMTGQRTQGPHSVSVTPSAEVVGLGFVERLGFGSLLGLGT